MRQALLLTRVINWAMESQAACPRSVTGHRRAGLQTPEELLGPPRDRPPGDKGQPRGFTRRPPFCWRRVEFSLWIFIQRKFFTFTDNLNNQYCFYSPCWSHAPGFHLACSKESTWKAKRLTSPFSRGHFRQWKHSGCEWKAPQKEPKSPGWVWAEAQKEKLNTAREGAPVSMTLTPASFRLF